MRPPTRQLIEHLGVSLRRILIGSVIGVVAGPVLGVVMGTVSWVRVVAEPVVTFIRALPRPGRIVLDLPIDLPRTGIAPDELRGLSDYAALRSEIGHAVRAAAQLEGSLR